MKESLSWLLAIISLALFFALFWRLDSIKIPNSNSKVRLLIETEPKSLGPGIPNDGKDVKIKLTAQNESDKSYDSQNYFYRVLSSRAYPYSMGVLLKEFSKRLDSKNGFSLEFIANDLFLQKDSKKFYLYFNLYKRNGNKEPILVATGRKIMIVE